MLTTLIPGEGGFPQAPALCITLSPFELSKWFVGKYFRDYVATCSSSNFRLLGVTFIDEFRLNHDYYDGRQRVF